MANISIKTKSGAWVHESEDMDGLDLWEMVNRIVVDGGEAQKFISIGNSVIAIDSIEIVRVFE